MSDFNNRDRPQDNHELSDDILQVFHDFELQEKNARRKQRRHEAAFTKDLLETCFPDTSPFTEDSVMEICNRDELLQQINQLSPTQSRRIYAVFFQGISQSQLAKLEGVSRAAITICIKKGLRKIFLKKLQK